MKNRYALAPLLVLALQAGSVLAAPPAGTQNLSAAQAALNKEVLAKPFSIEDYRSVEIYIRDRHAKGLRPAEIWSNSDDCEELTNINKYRDCKYYKTYYEK